MHRIRKIKTVAPADFDEQLWPINVALLVLFGFVAGTILALSDFHEPRLLHNGWFHLGTLCATMVLLLCGAIWLGGRAGRRLQLGALASLLIHLCLGLQLYVYTVEKKLAATTDRDVPVKQEEVPTYPEYHPQAFDSELPAMEHEKP